MAENIPLEDLEIYRLALQIGEITWNIVTKWDSFAKRTIGEQLVKASDSIAENIAEGYGRYFFKDRKQFCYFSRGSLMETKIWIFKSFERRLITQTEYDEMLDKLKILHFKLNIYIKKSKEALGINS